MGDFKWPVRSSGLHPFLCKKKKRKVGLWMKHAVKWRVKKTFFFLVSSWCWSMSLLWHCPTQSRWDDHAGKESNIEGMSISPRVPVYLYRDELLLVVKYLALPGYPWDLPSLLDWHTTLGSSKIVEEKIYLISWLCWIFWSLVSSILVDTVTVPSCAMQSWVELTNKTLF